MGLLDSILGSFLGGGDKQQMLATLANSLITNHGSGQGLGGLVQQFESAGLGPAVQSWVSTGPNQGISATQVQQVLGSEFVQRFAQQHGIDLNMASTAIAQLLPQLVNHATPEGQVPAHSDVQSMLAGLLSGDRAPS